MRVVASTLTSFSLGTGPRRCAFVLELVDEEGRVGQGEAAPFVGFSIDDAGSCERALEHARVKIDPIDLDQPADVAVSSAVAAALHPLDSASLPAARFALETALLDLIGQRRGASIAQILRGHHSSHPVAVNGLLVASPDAADLLRRARQIVERGIKAIKFKLRSPDESAWKRDLEALSIVRSELPPSIEIRFDANGAFTLDQARQRLADLAPLAPAFVEQPVAAHELPLLGRCAVPWAADESLLHETLAARLLDAEGCSAFILKPAALGLLRARDLAERAFRRGLGVVVTHFFDGPLGFAAACELALALSRAPMACGLDPHPGFASWPEAPVPHASLPGFVSPSNTPGLGVRFDPRSGGSVL